MTEVAPSQTVPRPPFVAKPPLLGAAYVFASAFIALSQSLGQGFLSANTQVLAGELGATTTQATWLLVAFMAPRACLPIMLIKIRTQFGLRRFAEVSIVIYVTVALLSLWTSDIQSALIVELLSGISAAPLSTLAFLYMLEPLPPQKKLTVGLPLALTFISLGTPLGRALSPLILENGSWTNILLLKLGMSMICLMLVFLLPLANADRLKVIRGMDFVSFALIATSFGGLVACFTMGSTYWWTAAPWIGEVMIVSIITLAVALIIELYRKAPLLDVRWLMSPAMLHLTAALLIFRIILSEQTAGAPGLFQALGFSSSQMASLYWAITAATLLAGVALTFVLKPNRVPMIHIVCLLFIASGALMDSNGSALASPSDRFLSQSLIAAAAALFLPSAMAVGLVTALSKGPQYLLSFIIVFLSSQIIGGTIGAGLFRTFVTARITAHSQWLQGQLATGDPLVTAQLSSLAASLSGQVSDQLLLKSEAALQLATAVTREATVAAYNDVFAVIAAIALSALAVLFGHLLLDRLRTWFTPTAQPAS